MEKESIQRKHIRFSPDPLTAALIDGRARTSDGFEPQHIALVVDEAPMGGCCLVVCQADELTLGKACFVKVGKLAPLAAKVVWRRELGEQVAKIGCEFLE